MQVHCLLTGTPWLRTGWWWWVRCIDTRGSATSPTSSSYQVSSFKTSLSLLITSVPRPRPWRSTSAWAEIQWQRTTLPPWHLGWKVSLKFEIISRILNLTYLLRCEPLPRFVLKGPCYNPLDVMNCLMTRRGYKVSWGPIPNEYKQQLSSSWAFNIHGNQFLESFL